MGYKYLNLEFLKTLIPESEIKNILEFAAVNFNEIIQEVKVSVEKKDPDTLFSHTHQLKSNLDYFGMKDLAAEMKSLELDARYKQNLDTLFVRVDSALKQCDEAVLEILEEIKKKTS